MADDDGQAGQQDAGGTDEIWPGSGITFAGWNPNGVLGGIADMHPPVNTLNAFMTPEQQANVDWGDVEPPAGVSGDESAPPQIDPQVAANYDGVCQLPDGSVHPYTEAGGIYGYIYGGGKPGTEGQAGVGAAANGTAMPTRPKPGGIGSGGEWSLDIARVGSCARIDRKRQGAGPRTPYPRFVMPANSGIRKTGIAEALVGLLPGRTPAERGPRPPAQAGLAFLGEAPASPEKLAPLRAKRGRRLSSALPFGRSSFETVHRTISFALGEPLLTHRVCSRPSRAAAHGFPRAGMTSWFV